MKLNKSPKLFLRGELSNDGKVHLIERLPCVRYQMKKFLSNFRDRRNYNVWEKYVKTFLPKD